MNFGPPNFSNSSFGGYASIKMIDGSSGQMFVGGPVFHANQGLPTVKMIDGSVGYMKKIEPYVSNNVPLKEFKTNLLGCDTCPSGFLHRWGEDEKRTYLFGIKTEAEIDISYFKAEQKRKSEYIPIKIEPLEPPMDLVKIMEDVKRKNNEANLEMALSCLKTFEPPKPAIDIEKIMYDIEKKNNKANSKLFEYKNPEPVFTPDPELTKLMMKNSRPEIDLASIVRVTEDETVYEGAGHSHFSFVKNKGYHVTTHLPKMGLRENSFSLHDNVDDMDL